MWQVISTEIEGWREAFKDRVIVAVLVWRVVWTALAAAAGVLGTRYAEPLVVVLVVAWLSLVLSLAWLRVTGHE